MASTYTPLGIELMATGENAGTWGTKTNTNLNIIEQISGGYISQAIAGTGTTAFTETDGGTGSLVASRVIIFTGALTGSRIVTFPVGVENFYLIKNGTTGTETLQLKAASGSGATVTWATDDKDWKLVYFDGVATNTGVVDLGLTTAANAQTLTNKTLTAPKIADAGFIADANGAEQIIFQTTGSAVNELEVTNAATGNPPILGASGETNVGLHIKPKGTGETIIGTGAAAATLTTSGAHDLVLDTNAGTNSGTITITDGANADMTAAPNGYGRFTIDGQGKIESLAEKITVEATAATGTKNYDVLTQAVWYYTSAATGNWTLNIRGDGSTSLNDIMDAGESVTIVHAVTQTGSAYYNSAVQIDGSGVTPEWQGGSAPSAGNTNSIDVYTYTVIKTSDATFTTLAAQTQFA